MPSGLSTAPFHNPFYADLSLHCRSRKSKCGAVAPSTCEPCLALSLRCRWPDEDGRSTAARRRRRRYPFLRKDQCLEISGDGDNAGDGDGNGSGSGDYGDRIEPMSDVHPCPWPSWTFTNNQPQPTTAEAFNNNNNNSNSNNNNDTDDDDAQAQTYQSVQVIAGQGAVHDQQASFNCEGLTPFLAGFNDPITGGVLSSVNEFAWTADNALILDHATDVVVDRSGSRGLDSAAMTPGCGIVLVSWRRPHGSTAITPGLKRIKLRVRLANRCLPSCMPIQPDSRTSSCGTGTSNSDGSSNNHPWCDSSWDPRLYTSDGSIRMDILPHLLDLFNTHLSCLFPFLDPNVLTQHLETSTGPSFLLNSIAAASARFSAHPSIAIPNMQPSDYGSLFCIQAKGMLGSMLSVPSRSTVVALALLALVGAGNDSESEVWMLMGMAIRMSQDLGLHLDSTSDSQVKPEDRRCDRLLFWSIFILDCALSFGVGRKVSIDLGGITQSLPTADDIRIAQAQQTPSPFPAIASLFLRFAPIINILNGSPGTNAAISVDANILGMVGGLVSEYTQLPTLLEWDASNMRSQIQAGNACSYIWLHMWFHAILASMDCGSQPNPNARTQASSSRSLNPFSSFSEQQHHHASAAIALMWPEDGARGVCDIVNLANMTDFPAYCSIPFFNQPLFIGASFFVSQIERMAPLRRVEENHSSTAAAPGLNASNLFAVQKHKKSIATLRAALKSQSRYWSGIGWILGSLEQRIEGSIPAELDLEKITEQSPNSLPLPDFGLLRSMAQGSEVAG